MEGRFLDHAARSADHGLAMLTDWLWRILQMAIIILAGWWMIYMQFTTSGIVIGLFGLGVAWLLTVLPFKIALWLHQYRRHRGLAARSTSVERGLARNDAADHEGF